MNKVPSWCRKLNTQSKKRAGNKDLEYGLSPEIIYKMYNDTDGRCSVTGLYLNIENDPRYTKNPLYPSVDRIDSRLGYTPDNCRIVCVCANYAMNEWGDWTLHQMAKGISEGGLQAHDPEKKRLVNEARSLEIRNEELRKKNKELERARMGVFPHNNHWSSYEERKKVEADIAYDMLGGEIRNMMHHNDHFRARMMTEVYYFIAPFYDHNPQLMMKMLRNPGLLVEAMEQIREERDLRAMEATARLLGE